MTIGSGVIVNQSGQQRSWSALGNCPWELVENDGVVMKGRLGYARVMVENGSGLRKGGLTPHPAVLASQGVLFANARCVVTHTTRALFALLTGRVPSASQDIAETVPVDQPYAGYHPWQCDRLSDGILPVGQRRVRVPAGTCPQSRIR
jgi:hypothetical protein